MSALALTGSAHAGGSSASAAAAEAVASRKLFERLVQKVQPELEPELEQSELEAEAETDAARERYDLTCKTLAIATHSTVEVCSSCGPCPASESQSPALA